MPASNSPIASCVRSDRSDLLRNVRPGYAHPKLCGVTKLTIAVQIDHAIGERGESVDERRMYIVRVLRRTTCVVSSMSRRELWGYRDTVDVLDMTSGAI